MKTRIHRLIGAFLVFVLSLSVFAFPKTASATGRGKIQIGMEAFNEFAVTKTIDISESTIGITVPEADRKALSEEAKKSAFRWLYYSILLGARYDVVYERVYRYIDDYCEEQGPYYPSTAAERQELRGLYDSLLNGMLFKHLSDYGLWNKYWQDNQTVNPSDDLLSDYPDGFDTGILSESDKKIPDSVLQTLNDLMDAGTIEEVIARLKSGTLQLPLEGDTKETIDMLNGKIEEIYNDKFSDYLTPALADALPVKATFELGYNSKKEDVTVDFGADGQFYDQILSEGMANAVPDQEDEVDLLRDNRTLGYHIFMIDGGSLYSSDCSQYSSVGLRDQKAFPGWHWLLEVGDPLGSYSWARYSPAYPNKYTQTFNLHLNPAVTYYYDLLIDEGFDIQTGKIVEPWQLPRKVAVDLITDVEFDGDGRVLSVTKPIVLIDALWKLLPTEKGAFGATKIKEGTYSLTLKEKNIDCALDGNGMLPDQTEYTLTAEVNDVGAVLVKEAKVMNVLAELTDVEVTKTWDDQKDKDGLRPTAEEFAKKLTLYADGKEVDAVPTVKDNGDDTYTAVWKDLSKFSDNTKKPIEYTVKEADIEGYESTIDGLAITNKHTPAEPEQKKIKISKVDAKGNELNGAKLEVSDESDQVLASWTSGGEPKEIEIKPGVVYTFREAEAPFGYKKVEEVLFSISEDGVLTIDSLDAEHAEVDGTTLVVTDPRDLEEAGPVNILKVDEKGNPLPGAKMQLKDKNGNITDEWISTTEPHTIKVKPSDYYIIEVEAPAGYDKISDIHIVTDNTGAISKKEDKGNAAFIDGQNIDVQDLPTGYTPPTPPKKEEETKPESAKPAKTPITPTDAKKTSAPKTGVEDHLALYLGLALLSFAALQALIKKRRAL